MAAAGVNVNQQGASYIIGKDDTTYYAVKCSNGTVASTNADAGVVINAALTACAAAGGGKVKVNAGTFVATTGINRPAQCVLEGEGPDATIIQAGGAITLLTLSSAVAGYESRGAIKSLTLDGNGVGTLGIVATRKYIETIEDVWIDDFTSHGIEASDIVYWWMNRVRIISCGGWGARFFQSGAAPTTLDCQGVTISWCTTGGMYTEVHSSQFHNNCGFESEPIGLQLKSVQGAAIEGCWFESLTDKGIFVDGVSANRAFIIQGNNFSGVLKSIYIGGTVNNYIKVGPNYHTNCGEAIYAEKYSTVLIEPQAYDGTTPVFDTNLNRTWRDSMVSPWTPTYIDFIEDFLGDAISTRWDSTIVGSGTWAIVSSLGGLVRGATSATTDDTNILHWGGNRSTATAKNPRLFVKQSFPTSKDDVDYRVGLTNGGILATNHCVMFETLTADTNWFAVTSDGTTQTRTDTGIAKATGSIIFEIECESASHRFYINGVLVATNTTNVPLSSTYLEAWIQITTKTTAAKLVDVDCFIAKWSRT